MHGNVALEVEFSEVSSKKYAEMFVEALESRFNKKLSKDQLALLSQAIEDSRLSGQAPVDLAENLSENWEVIFG